MAASLFGSGLVASDAANEQTRLLNLEAIGTVRASDFHPPQPLITRAAQADVLLAAVDNATHYIPVAQPTYLASVAPDFGEWFDLSSSDEAETVEAGSEFVENKPIQVGSIAPDALADFSEHDLTLGIGDLNEIKQILDAPINPTGEETVTDSATDSTPDVDWVKHKIKRGDTLSTIFKRRGGNLINALEIAKLDSAKWLKSLRPGRTLDLHFANDGNLAELRYELDAIRYRSLERDAGGTYVSTERERNYEIRQNQAHGVIRSSLFQAAGKTDISDKMVAKFAGIFGWSIDFSSEIQPGDQFSLIYDEKIIAGKIVGEGVIHAAEFIHDGDVYRAIRHVDDEGYESYYTPEGQSLKRAFLRSPMQFSRVTSGFSKRRFHPVLKKWRAHKGVDYGAPRGTPVLATADGRITHLGRKGGYGKTIILKHGHQYSTLYAHLKGYKKGLKGGAKVRQGDVIGYVGSTGLATGPHLHYEFRINGTHRNPLTVELPTSNPIEEKYRVKFLQHAKKWVVALDAIDQPLLAATDNSAD